MRRFNSLIQRKSRNTFSRFLIHHSDIISIIYNKALEIDKNKDMYYRITQAIVFSIRCITLVSYLYFPCIWWFDLNSSHFGGETIFAILTTWMVVEMIFFVLYYMQYVRFNERRPELKHKAQSRAARLHLVRTCFSAMSDGAEDQSPEGLIKHFRKVLNYNLLTL